jgi:peptidoglycan/xylan/chitin deacetylase (PgdA/CDA1 family)
LFLFALVAAYLIRPAIASDDAWGLDVPGVKTVIETDENLVALTLDACGSIHDGYDRDLIEFLRREQIPATLFINARWARKFPKVVEDLAGDPLFRIENHGTAHRPMSYDGQTAYGIGGTASAQEIVAEVAENSDLITRMTARRPIFFRAGTAHYAAAAIPLIQSLGETVVGFDVNADLGATATVDQIVYAARSVRPGSIVIAHMNHPAKSTAEGISLFVASLKSRGYRFVLLEGKSLREGR